MQRLAFAALACLLGTQPILTEDLRFSSPSGNILCALSAAQGAACFLGIDRQTHTTPPAGCRDDWGAGFAVGPDGRGNLLCYTDLFVGAPDFVLPYGAEIAVGGTRCQSSRAGMTCLNRDGGGFAISRMRQTLF